LQIYCGFTAFLERIAVGVGVYVVGR